MATASPYLGGAAAVLAGVWLGCLVFTTFVVSPALKGLDWPESTRVLVRSAIGRSFRWVANPLLFLLAAAIVLAGLSGSLAGAHLARFVAELVVLALIGLLASSHGFFFGTRMQRLAAAERNAGDDAEAAAVRASRGRLQQLSFGVSIADLVASLVLAILVIPR